MFQEQANPEFRNCIAELWLGNFLSNSSLHLNDHITGESYRAFASAEQWAGSLFAPLLAQLA
jgi:hypothetical protein